MGAGIGGSGFFLSAAEYERLAENPHNRECLLPFLGGEEVNRSPTQSHERYAICFGSKPLVWWSGKTGQVAKMVTDKTL